MKQLFFIMSLLLFCTGAKAQKGVQELIERTPTAYFVQQNVFKTKLANSERTKILNTYVSRFELLEADKTVLSHIASRTLEALEIDIPYKGSTLTLQLVQNKTVDAQTIFTEKDDKGEKSVAYQQGAYYSGVIKNDPNSLVALSFFENDIVGVIITQNDHLVLGKSNTSEALSNEYILYNEDDLKAKDKSDCYTDEHAEGAPMILDAPQTGLGVSNCVRVYIECDRQMYLNHGSNTTNVLNYVTGLFNVVTTLYQNETILTAISQVLVWTTTDPYASTTNTSAALTAFQNAMAGGFNGDLAHLFSARSLGGGKASGFGVLCHSNNGMRSAVSGNLTTTTPTFPTYSWNSMVVTHEMGHCLGSRHTHACVWNGNNTAIDGCAGFVEGSCALPSSPSAGGTIMSYCHTQSVGINFNLGFGPQPGNAIRNHVYNAPCLGACTPCPANVTISGTYTTALTESQSWIKTSNTTTIPSTGNVRLDATPTTGFVELNIGFSTTAGCVFVAQAFNGCTSGAPSLQMPTQIVQKSIPTTPIKNTEEVILESSVPNPASNETNISYILPANMAGAAQLIIRDVAGREVAHFDVLKGTSERIKVNVSDWSRGFYIYSLVVNGKVLTSKKLVVQR
jgi:hypothetical protein